MVFLVLGLGIVLLITGMNGGCGETNYESSTYYYPNWMPDGRIICYKVTSKWSTAIWGRKELGDTYYITAMNSDGSNEQNLFEVSADGVKEITCSPTGELIAYITTPDSKIATINYSGTNKTILSGITGVSYLDWSPDATKIVYSANRKLYVVNVDGSNNTQIATSAEAVAWRVGEKIAFVTYTGTQSALTVSVMNTDGTNIKYLKTFASDPQILTGTDEVIYSGLGNEVRKVKLDGNEDVLLFSSYDKATLKLSFDNTKIVGGDLDQSWIKGIYTVNIDGTGAKRLR